MHVSFVALLMNDSITGLTKAVNIKKTYAIGKDFVSLVIKHTTTASGLAKAYQERSSKKNVRMGTNLLVAISGLGLYVAYLIGFALNAKENTSERLDANLN